MITTTDPRSASTRDTGIHETSATELDVIVREAAAAGAALRACGRAGRADFLDLVGDLLLEGKEELVATALAETGLAEARLASEVVRSAHQARLMAEALREGSIVEAVIDHAADTVLGPAPDLRRMLVPLGPVAVFGASNFPFAFSVVGGDTVSALAAGCPVVVKGHSAHPLTALVSARVISDAATRVGLSSSVLSLVFGRPIGLQLVRHPGIAAVGFTGSLTAGKALLQAIAERPDPIPFYGELSSLNPVFVTEAALAARGTEIAEGLFASFTGSAGQLCTKPGLVLVPDSAAGTSLLDDLRERTHAASAQVMLGEGILSSFEQRSSELAAAGADVLAQGIGEGSSGFRATPSVFSIRARDLAPTHLEECFGPLLVAATYTDTDELFEVCARTPPSLTASVHSEIVDGALVRSLVDVLATRVGRLIFDGFPTGVRVSWAQHHGGPWPSTNSVHTSVGVTAIRRFMRPLAWQGAPSHLLPAELRDAETGLPRRVDGVLELRDGPAQ